MTKKRISADELTHILREKLREGGRCPPEFPVAVVPNKVGPGWTAITAALARSRYPACVKFLATLERDLQAVYILRR